LHFQALKEKQEKTIGNAHVETPSGDHPKGVVDLEIVKIASEDLTTSEGPGAAKTVAGVACNDAEQEERMEV
jgi:hypothetical protein